MSGRFHHAGRKPLYDELVRLVVGCGNVQADETTVRVINKGKGKADREYLWMVRAVMEKPVIFHYEDGPVWDRL